MSLGMSIKDDGARLESDGKIDLVVAQQNIELLELMGEKTSGNRTVEESELLKKLLFDLKMRFTEVQKN